MLLRAVLAEPGEDAARCALLDEMQECGCRDRATALRWVLANKENDGPRLLYADIAEREGDPDRAEFVRVQIELAKVMKQLGLEEFTAPPGDDCDHPWCELRRRERKLLAVVGYDLVNAPQVWPVSMTIGRGDTGDGTGRLTIRRGFVERWQLAAESWLEYADAILAAQPVERVRLTTEVLFTNLVTPDWDDYRLVSLPGRVKRHRVNPGEDPVRVALSGEWPGIEFELPPVPAPEVEFEDFPDPPAGGGYTDAITAYTDQLIKGAGLPPEYLSGAGGSASYAGVRAALGPWAIRERLRKRR
jgi:uncharacterized protein (TIGR02996 family)